MFAFSFQAMLCVFSVNVLLFEGIGMACMEPVSITMLGNYFEKRRGLANSIANSGGSLGGLVFAPLLTAMFQYYGYSGTMLLCGAFFLHGFISGALFRSQTFYTNRRKKSISKLEINKEPDTTPLKNGASKSIEFIRQHLQINNSPVKTFRSENALPTAVDYRSKSSKRKRTYTDSEAVKTLDPLTRIKTDTLTSAECIGGSQYDIPAVIHFDINSEAQSGDSKIMKRSSSCFRSFSNFFDFSLFRNPVFIIYLIGAGILCTPHALCMLYLAPHAKDMGIDSKGIATLYTVYSAIDMCSRIVIGAISDKKWIRRSTMIGIGSCSISLLSHLMRYFTTYGWFMLYAVVFGLIGGTYFTLYAVVIIDYLTLAKLQSSLGLTILLQAIIVSSSFAVLGKSLPNTETLNGTVFSHLVRNRTI